MTNNQLPTTLTCPKCGSDMRTYERNSVIIDQCTDCRGIFLDRGELERLVSAESDYYGSSREAPPTSRGGEGKGHHDERYAGGHGQKSPRRRGFLGELFD